MVATVFVGNVPWDATEQQLRGIFSECGPVLAFRLVTDQHTGKSKGYGFCEYREREAAETAMRSLNGREVNGRNIRVDFADGGMAKKSGGPDAMDTPAAGLVPGQPGVGVDAARAAAAAAASFLGASGGGVGVTGGDEAVNAALGAMSKTQLFEVMSQMKGLVAQNKAQAREILVNNPQLCRALFQAQVMLGMVGGSQQGVDGGLVLAEAAAVDAAERPPPGYAMGAVAGPGGNVAHGNGVGGNHHPGAPGPGPGPGRPMMPAMSQMPPQPQAPQPQAPQPQFVPPQPQPPQHFVQQAPIQQYPHPGVVQHMQQQQQQQQQQQMMAAMPQPQPQQQMPQPQMMAAPQMMPQQAVGAGGQMDPNMQESLIRQVMSMSQDEIAQLPEAQRMQVMQIIQLRMQGRV